MARTKCHYRDRARDSSPAKTYTRVHSKEDSLATEGDQGREREENKKSVEIGYRVQQLDFERLWLVRRRCVIRHFANYKEHDFDFSYLRPAFFRASREEINNIRGVAGGRAAAIVAENREKKAAFLFSDFSLSLPRQRESTMHSPVNNDKNCKCDTKVGSTAHNLDV